MEAERLAAAQPNTFGKWFVGSPSWRAASRPWRPEMYLIWLGLWLLVRLMPGLGQVLFHWPMIFIIGLVGLIAKEWERRKGTAAGGAQVKSSAPAPPKILQYLHDFTSCAFLALPVVMTAAVVSPDVDLMIPFTVEVVFPLVNLRSITSLIYWLVYRFVYGR
jgi:hypothetical protein